MILWGWSLRKDLQFQMLLLALTGLLGGQILIGTVTAEHAALLSPYTLSRVCLHFFFIPVWMIVLMTDRADRIIPPGSADTTKA